MHDKNEIRELTSTLFTLRGLSQDLSQERDVIMTAAGQINFSSKQFKNHSDKFGDQIEQLNKNIQAIISQEIKNTGKLIAEEASRSFIDISTAQTKNSIKNLLEMTQRCHDQIEKASKKTTFSTRRVIASCIGTAIIGGLIGGTIIHYTFPKIDKEMLHQLNYGATFKDLWSKLPNKEQEKLMSFINSQSRK